MRVRHSCGCVVEALEIRQLLTTLPSGFVETHIGKISSTVVTGFAFTPDGKHAYISDSKNSQIRVVDNGALQSTPFVTVPNVDHYFERGINGIAVDPNFATNRYIYVYYTKQDPANPNVGPSNAMARIVRYQASASNLDVADTSVPPRVILDNIPMVNGNHNGGTMVFDADGMLYLGIGDNKVTGISQDLSKLNGKILRLDVRDGHSVIPADNPFAGQSGKRGEIWAYGFRNPFSGAIKKGTNTLYINDVGERTWEEIDDVQKGKNYGWPIVEGVANNPSYVDPIYQYHLATNEAIVGGGFYTSTGFGSPYTGSYFFGDEVLQTIRYLTPDKVAHNFATLDGQITDLEQANDGSLWYVTLAGDINVISKAGVTNHAPDAVISANATTGPAPLAVSFSGASSTDPDGDPLSYSWSFGDGATGSGKTISHTYQIGGTYTAKLTVSDGRGGVDSSTLLITAGNRAPAAKITSPINNSLYSGGQVITFSGTGTDPEDGTLAASKFEWVVLLHHQNHTHPFETFTGVTGGTFTIPKVGETDPVQYYHITLTVMDSKGAKTSTSVDVKPRTSNFTLATNVAGLKINLDGTPKTTPSTTTGVVGMTRTLSAALTQTLNGKTYGFVSWSDGKAATHTIDTPSTATTYTAKYQLVTTATLRAVADSTVRGGAFASQNFGLSTELDVKKHAMADFTRQAYLRFDISTVGSSVSSAKIRLYGKLSSSESKNLAIEIVAVSNTTWGETTINFTNKPAPAASAIGKITVLDTTPRYYELDVTSYIKSQKAAGKTLVSFLLRAPLASSPLAIFNSDEAASNKPQLVVVSTTGAAAAPLPAPTPFAAGSLALSSTARDVLDDLNMTDPSAA